MRLPSAPTDGKPRAPLSVRHTAAQRAHIGAIQSSGSHCAVSRLDDENDEKKKKKKKRNELSNQSFRKSGDIEAKIGWISNALNH
jgi:hypothetical protein